jgi:hypothetical protein
MSDRDFPPQIPKDHVPMPFSFADLEADPYSCAIRGIRILIRTAVSSDDSMSEGEKANLVSIEELVRTLDNS